MGGLGYHAHIIHQRGGIMPRKVTDEERRVPVNSMWPGNVLTAVNEVLREGESRGKSIRPAVTRELARPSARTRSENGPAALQYALERPGPWPTPSRGVPTMRDCTSAEGRDATEQPMTERQFLLFGKPASLVTMCTPGSYGQRVLFCQGETYWSRDLIEAPDGQLWMAATAVAVEGMTS